MAGGRVSGGGKEQLEGGDFSEGNMVISDQVLGGCPVGVSMIN